MKYKSLFCAGIFLLGFYFGYSYDKKIVEKPFVYKVRHGFYRNPYDLRIVRKEVCGEVEVYLVDVETGVNKKIGPNMHLGGLEDRLTGVLSLPFETRNDFLSFLF